MPRLSIVVPCLGGAADFDGTLVSLLQHRPDDCELLVVHTEPYDDPYALSGEVSFIHAADAQSLVELINLGLEAARGDIVHLVACGLEVEEGWTEAALDHFDDAEIAAVAPVVLAADRTTVLIAGIMWTLGGTRCECRSHSPMMLGPKIHAGFWRRTVLTALDGFEASLGDELADVGLGLALRDLHCKVVGESRSRVVQIRGHVASGQDGSLVTGQRCERLFWRQAGQSLGVALLSHAFAVLGDCLSRLPGLGAMLAPLGRLLALTELGAVQQYQRRLVRADRCLLDSAESHPATVSLKDARCTPSRSAQGRKAA